MLAFAPTDASREFQDYIDSLPDSDFQPKEGDENPFIAFGKTIAQLTVERMQSMRRVRERAWQFAANGAGFEFAI